MRTAGFRALISTIAIAVGGAVMSVPVALAWLLGSSSRRLWIISGPRPFSLLGSGPLQLWIGIGGLGLGSLLIWIGRRSLVHALPDRR